MTCLAGVALALLSTAPAPAPAPAAVLTYARPDTPDAGIESYEFTAYGVGGTAFVVTDEANLREGPSADAGVRATLPIGAEVRVRAVGRVRERVQDRVDHWYEVERLGGPDGGSVAGFVFGNVLTPFAFAADFDGDARPDLATVGFSADFKIRTRLRLSRTGRVTAVDVRPAGEGFTSRSGGSVTASLVPARVAGVPLVKLESRIEQCGDFADHYVSGADGAKLALSLQGMSDPPVEATFEVRFEAKRREALVTRTNRNDEVEDGAPQTVRERLRLDRGVYVPAKP